MIAFTFEEDLEAAALVVTVHGPYGPVAHISVTHDDALFGADDRSWAASVTDANGNQINGYPEG